MPAAPRSGVKATARLAARSCCSLLARLRRSVANPMLSSIPIFPPQASTFAADVDKLYFLILAVTSFFALAVIIFVAIFAIKYQDETGTKVGAPIHGSIPLELAWSFIPFVIAVGIFAYATVVYFELVRPPAETLDRKSVV